MKKLIVLASLLATQAMAAENCIVNYNASEQIVTCTRKADESVALPKYDYNVDINSLKLQIIQTMQGRGYDLKAAEGYNLFFGKH